MGSCPPPEDPQATPKHSSTTRSQAACSPQTREECQASYPQGRSPEAQAPSHSLAPSASPCPPQTIRPPSQTIRPPSQAFKQAQTLAQETFLGPQTCPPEETLRLRSDPASRY